MEKLIEHIFSEIPSKISRLPGGDINDVYEVAIKQTGYIIKINDEQKFPGMLRLEALGLENLAASKCIKTPSVIKNGCADGKQYLVLEKIHQNVANEKTWEYLGHQLAKLHQCSSESFGFLHDNYIGSLIQKNTLQKNWVEFLISCRLQPMIELAVNQGDVNFVEAKIFDSLYKQLDSLIPKEQPTLLHGDLWSGNFLVDLNEEPVLIDPVVYYGHREMDLAMMHLFGGFSPLVFDIYNETFPLQKDWRKRIELNQLYPLLVHVNLFGRSYWGRVAKIVSKYI